MMHGMEFDGKERAMELMKQLKMILDRAGVDFAEFAKMHGLEDEQESESTDMESESAEESGGKPKVALLIAAMKAKKAKNAQA